MSLRSDDPKAINLVVRFVLEIVVLVALAWWGFSASGDLVVRLIAGLGAPLAVMAVWATFVSPRAPRRLPDPTRLGVEVAVFGLGVAALWLVGQAMLALVLAAAAAVSLGLMVAWRQRGL